MRTHTLSVKGYSLFIFLFYFSFTTYSQQESFLEKPTYEEVQTLFQKIGTYDKMVIQTNLDSLMLNKKSRGDQPATIFFHGENQPILKFQTKIKARGKFRRVKCDIAPLKLNFSKSELVDYGLYRNFDKLKLVTHCYLDGSVNDVVLKEHWVYKMHNHISDYSFQVKLFTVIYEHDNDPSRTIEGEGFIIEPDVEMAYRNNTEIVDSMGTKIQDVTPDSYHNLLMFNYMIGNTDWNIPMQKNMKFLRKDGIAKLIIVPYDFDNCKLVDAPYMSLYPDAKVVKLDNRYAKEKFLSKDALHQKISFFKPLNIKSKLFCFHQCEKLKRGEKLNMQSYLRPFFKSIKKKKKMGKLFLTP